MQRATSRKRILHGAVAAARSQQTSADSTASLVLIGATIAALIFANTALISEYHQFLSTPVEVRVGDFRIAKPVVLWINDGLMAIFFFVVGLEIKAELTAGTLSTRAQAAVPLAAALGGMAAPAAIYAAITWNEPALQRGWAIPAATDIAFAVGILGLIGRRVPASLRAFLLALAVLDDLGAVIIIALFYTAKLSTLALVLAAFFIAALAVLNRLGVTRAAAYVLVGIGLWLCVLESGVHATLAGVITALFVPLKGKPGEPDLAHAMADDLRLPVALGIVPLFAFANAGVPLIGLGLQSLANTVTSGVSLGLLLGKPIGIGTAVALLVWSGAGRLPAGLNWKHIAGSACLAGIGFTMSLFIGTLAFDASATMNEVRLGVLLGSTVSAVLGIVILLRATNQRAHRSA